MRVRVRVLFEPPTAEDWEAMRSMAGSLTNDPQSVRVNADAEAACLVAEFTMRTAPQYIAVETVYQAIRLCVLNRMDTTIGFPATEAEKARAARKAERRRQRRGGR